MHGPPETRRKTCGASSGDSAAFIGAGALVRSSSPTTGVPCLPLASSVSSLGTARPKALGEVCASEVWDRSRDRGEEGH